jgi:hypothetical protein
MLSQRKKFRGYDGLCFGDNHQTFTNRTPQRKKVKTKLPPIINCGSLMRRKLNERQKKCGAYLLFDNGGIEFRSFDFDDEEFIDVDANLELLERALDVTDLSEALGVLGKVGSDIIESVERFIKQNGVNVSVRRILREALDKG